MASVSPYSISVDDSEIAGLKKRLSLAQLPTDLEHDNDAGWDLGCPLTVVKPLTQYWLNEFDWPEAERKINKLPQFKTNL